MVTSICERERKENNSAMDFIKILFKKIHGTQKFSLLM